jgi:short-subunit dehydrogenase
MNKFIDLTEKRVLVVGASSGIGEGVAKLLSDLGAHVDALSRRGKSLSLADIASITQHSLDVRNQNEIAEFIKGINLPYSGLVYCAGRTGKSPITTLNDELLDDVLEINLKGFLYFIKEMMRNKKLENDGAIVGVSSISAHIGIEGMVPYSASKAAMSASVRVLGRELSRRRIRINAISPAMVRTPLFTEGEQDWLNGVAKSYPLGLGEVEDVAAACAFFISDKSRFITGSDLIMTGGCPWLS